MVGVSDVSTSERRPDTGEPTDEAGEPDAPEVDAGSGADVPGDEGEDEGGDGPGGLSWGRVAVLGLALAFLGFAVGIFASRDTPPSGGSVDVGFYQDMITHHQQALGMSTLEIANGEDATVRSFAREVLTFQSMEVGMMRQTLSEWGLSPDERPAEAMGWMGMGVPVDRMTGLITDEQLDEMNDARGAEADRLFLQNMADHHLGGMHMAEYAAREASDPDVRALATRMARNQAQEINEYRLLAEREGIDVDIDPVDVPPAEPSS
jgi:uncharacterized protein (DUF305 family)